MLTSKCVSRHNGVHFFNISTSKSGPRMVCFVHFDFEMCFVVACTFSTSQLPKLLRTPQFLTHFTSKCASRHNGVHFFNISTSKTAPNLSVFNTCYFQMCFAPQRRALFNISTSKSGPTLRCFAPFHFEIGFAPQRRATFHLSSPQMSPHLPLQRAYFSTLRSHKTTKKHSVSRLSYLFAHLHLLSSDLFSSDSSPC